MKNNINVANLQPVSETFLITVYLRSLETKKVDGIIKDNKSVEIVNCIDYDFSKYNSPINQALIAIRTEVIDEFVSNFIVQYPNTTVVNLGTGLCTRFFRLDDGSIHWIGIDLPPVKPIWNSLLGETDRHQFYAYSVLDLDWIKKVKETKLNKVLFIAEGLLMFLSEIEVKYLLQNIRDNFTDSELIFDSLGVFLSQNSRRSSEALGIKISYKWGIKDLSEIENWGKRIKLVNQWYYLDRHKNRLGLLGLLSYLPLLRRQVKIGHLRFS
ncbi:MAG: class I SAM-dependent methyltransferase [Waterburya sp.]